jgi:heme exporter protein C
MSRIGSPGAVVMTAIVGAIVAVALFVVPADRLQGDAQRIMYVHVPMAWLAYLAFFVTLIGSIGYLIRRDLRFDRLAAASAELGLLFTAVTIVTGAIWGKVTWGIWWDWDPRLTTTAVMLVAYAGYNLLRGSIVERSRRARLAAVLGIVGFANVPIVHFSVLWWRGLHQAPTVVRPGGSSIAPVLGLVLLASVVAFTIAYVWLLRRRMALESIRDATRSHLESVS